MNFFWRPHPGVVYRAWQKGNDRGGHLKSAHVKIHIGDKIFDGTFMVKHDAYVIHLWEPGHRPKELAFPRDSVKIKKREKKGLGSQGYALTWHTITYDVYVGSDKGN